MSYHFVTTFLFLRPAKEKERQNLTSYRSLLVAGTGLEPATSGL